MKIKYDDYVKPLFFILVFLSFLSIANQNWLFSTPGWYDPYIYISYYFDWFNNSDLAESYYKNGRIPYFLPKIILFKIFSPEIAHYASVLGYLTALYFFFFKNLRFFFSEQISYIVLALFICSAPLIDPEMNGGADYHATPSLAYFVIGYYLFNRYVFAQHKTKSLFCWSVVFLVLSIYANAMNMLLMPSLGITYLLLLKQSPHLNLKKDIIISIIMSFLVTLFLVALIKLKGGEALSLFKQFGLAGKLLSGYNINWFQSFSMFLPKAYYIFPEMLAVVLVVFVFARKRNLLLQSQYKNYFYLMLQFSALMIANLVLHFLEQTVFAPGYFTQSMIPFTYMVYAVILGMYFEQYINKISVKFIQIFLLLMVLMPFIAVKNLYISHVKIFGDINLHILNSILYFVIIGFFWIVVNKVYYPLGKIFNCFIVVLLISSLSFMNVLSSNSSSIDGKSYFSIWNTDNFQRDFALSALNTYEYVQYLNNKYDIKSTNNNFIIHCSDDAKILAHTSGDVTTANSSFSSLFFTIYLQTNSPNHIPMNCKPLRIGDDEQAKVEKAEKGDFVIIISCSDVEVSTMLDYVFRSHIHETEILESSAIQKGAVKYQVTLAKVAS